MTVLNPKSARRADPMRLIRVLSVLTLITTYCLIVLDSTVRVTNSGMGCKDWPLCASQVGPLSTFHPLMESNRTATLPRSPPCSSSRSPWRRGARARRLTTCTFRRWCRPGSSWSRSCSEPSR
jgi:hypothetical protein